MSKWAARTGIPLAIVLGAALIAAAVLVVFRWEIVTGPGGTARLDRWSGEISYCLPGLGSGDGSFRMPCGAAAAAAVGLKQVSDEKTFVTKQGADGWGLVPNASARPK